MNKETAMTHTLTWYGHSNFKLETGGRTILLDPFFDGNPSCSTPSTDITQADLICVTHDHGDHLGQAVDIHKRTGAAVVGVYDTVSALVIQGLAADKALGMNIGGSVQAAGIRVKMVQAMHSSNTGVATGYILTLSDGFCLYFAGDTGIFASMELFGRLHSIDLAILPIDGHFNMDHVQAALACTLLGCRRVAPMHWGTFPILVQSTADFAAALAETAPGVELVALKPGQTVVLDRACVRCPE